MHFNAWLNGENVDPFAADGETSLWLDGNAAQTATEASVRADDPSLAFTTWDARRVSDAIDAAIDPRVRDALIAPFVRKTARGWSFAGAGSTS